MKPSPKKLKETKEIYEKVVTHLIEEGYASDVESADSIINGMSEQWFELITGELIMKRLTAKEVSINDGRG